MQAVMNTPGAALCDVIVVAQIFFVDKNGRSCLKISINNINIQKLEDLNQSVAFFIKTYQ